MHIEINLGHIMLSSGAYALMHYVIMPWVQSHMAIIGPNMLLITW